MASDNMDYLNGQLGDEEPASLDDIASMLVQLDPEDEEGRESLLQALKTLSRDGRLSPVARKLVTDAAARLAGLATGEAYDAQSVLSDVSRLIEAAMEVQEEADEDPKSEETQMGEPESVELHLEEVESVQPRPEEPQPAKPSAPKPASATFQLPQDSDPGLLGEYVTECLEYIEGAEAALLTLETDPDDVESVNVIFRAFHTIKGTSAFLGMDPICEFAHKAESLLSRVRDGEIRCTGGYADLSLRSVDVMKELVKQVGEALSGTPMVLPDEYDELMTVLSDPEATGISAESGDIQDVPRIGDILVAEGKASREEVEAAVERKGDKPLGEELLIADSAKLTDVAKALRTQQKLAGSDAGMEQSVRVRTDRLDRLIDTVGELVIAQSMVSQDGVVITGGHHDLSKKITHLGKIVRELQYLSMSMRMVPLKPTFQKMARLVRDVARKSGKQVNFTTEGEDTEIDRNMVDVINDPLVHMVRNAVDHGVESPAERDACGKPKTGTVKLMAYHSGGNVVVEMRDDGKGLSREKIVAKAISKGLIESDKGMSEHEVFNLIFEPGFSTAEKVTDISGRGVGLDVVRRNVEAIRGRIEITSEYGKGTTFILRLPLTLAVTDGMLVRVGQERFIIPTISIHRSFRPEPEAVSTVTGRGELVMLRGELMPIFRLHRLFEVDGAVEDPTQGILVILDDGDRRCAVLVDELLGQQHVVAKALCEGIGAVQGVSGGAILGDGRVGLILDPAEIASLARTETCGGEVVCR